jgi:hypothetical protein
MGRPAPRDNDSLYRLLSKLKADLGALARRSSVSIGKRWQLKEDGATGELVAVIPVSRERVVLGTPNGAPPALHRADALDGTLGYGPDGQLLGAVRSTDPGNALITGTDGGLHVPGGAPVLQLRFTGEGAPLGTYVHEGDLLDYPTIAELSPPYDAVNYSGEPDLSAWTVVTGNGGTLAPIYDDEHLLPGSTVSVKIPAHTWPSWSGAGSPDTMVGFWLAPLRESGMVNGPWVGDWLEIEFCIYIDADPSPQLSQNQSKMCFLRFYPGLSIWLTSNNNVEMYNSANFNGTAFPAGTKRVIAGSGWAVGRWARVRVKLTRDGICWARIFYDPTTATSPVNGQPPGVPVRYGEPGYFDDGIIMSGVAVDFGPNGWGDVPFVYVGSYIVPERYDPPVTAPTYADNAVTAPDIWLDDITVRFAAPDRS